MYYRRVVVFFFKQKTAYEMRIRDWSSDVCSSDLHQGFHTGGSAMRWSAFSLFCMLGLSAVSPQASAVGEDYGVLIISRERLEVPTSCEIGIYIDRKSVV